MSFEEYNTTSSFNNASGMSSYASDPNKSKMVEFLIKRGIVKTESAGNAILLVFALVLIGISIYMMYNTLAGDNTAIPTPVEENTEVSAPVDTTE